MSPAFNTTSNTGRGREFMSKSVEEVRGRTSSGVIGS